jgi:hypothetical protein
MKDDEQARRATLQLIKLYDRHQVDHVLADQLDLDGCTFCSMEESIALLKQQPQRNQMWDHYLEFTKALQK